MKAGKLRHRIQIQTLPATLPKNSFNEPDLINSWYTLATVWAEVSPIGGRESFFGAQITGDSTHGVRLRYYQGLNSTMRFLFFDPKTKTNRALNIENVNDFDERNYMMSATCHESTGQV